MEKTSGRCPSAASTDPRLALHLNDVKKWGHLFIYHSDDVYYIAFYKIRTGHADVIELELENDRGILNGGLVGKIQKLEERTRKSLSDDEAEVA